MVTEKLKQVKLLLLDVDGVLTNGGIVYDDNGTETKVFNVRDGLGIRLLMEAGISVGINRQNQRCPFPPVSRPRYPFGIRRCGR